MFHITLFPHLLLKMAAIVKDKLLYSLFNVDFHNDFTGGEHVFDFNVQKVLVGCENLRNIVTVASQYPSDLSLVDTITEISSTRHLEICYQTQGFGVLAMYPGL